MILGLSALSFAGGILHIVAGSVDSQLGSATITIASGEIIVNDTTIVASSIQIVGTKDVNGNVSWTTVDATGSVNVILKNATATANSMVYDINSESGSFNGGATMTIASSDESVKLFASIVNFNTKTNVFTGEGSPVIINKGNTHIEGKNFTYTSDENIFDVKNDVYLYNAAKKQKAWAEELFMNTKDNTISLKKVKMEISLNS